MDLKCKKLNCKHNKAFCCVSPAIKVKHNCECGTFERAKNLDEKQKQDISKNMFEVAPDMHPYRHKRNVNIECAAECVFNENSKCKANGISVCNAIKSAICVTFAER